MKLLKILVGLVVLLLVGLLVAGLFADSLAKKAIEQGGTYALGVDTKVDDVDIGFFDSSFALEGLEVANPEGFGDGSFLAVGSASSRLSVGSLFSDTIEIPELSFSGIRMQLVQGLAGSNYGKILDHLEQFQGKDDQTKGEGKNVIVDKLTIRDVVVAVKAVPELDLASVEVPIERIELTGIGRKNDQGVLVSELVGIVVEAILTRATASGQLPGLIQGNLVGDLGQLQGLADAGIQSLEGLLPGTGTEGADPVRDAIGEGLRRLGGGR